MFTVTAVTVPNVVEMSLSVKHVILDNNTDYYHYYHHYHNYYYYAALDQKCSLIFPVRSAKEHLASTEPNHKTN